MAPGLLGQVGNLSSINLTTTGDKLDQLAREQVSLISGTDVGILGCDFNSQSAVGLFLDGCRRSERAPKRSQGPEEDPVGDRSNAQPAAGHSLFLISAFSLFFSPVLLIFTPTCADILLRKRSPPPSQTFEPPWRK